MGSPQEKNSRLNTLYNSIEKKTESLQGSIVRASSWEQLFPSREAEMQDFLDNFVGKIREEYEGNNTFKEYHVEHDPKGDIHILERTIPGERSSFQKLENGDVICTFTSMVDGMEENHDSVITADIGNIGHSYTSEHTKWPDIQILNTFSEEEMERIVGTQLTWVTKNIPGKMANSGSEFIMLHGGSMPQRIGHRIFLDFVLPAQVRFRNAYPELFVNETGSIGRDAVNAYFETENTLDRTNNFLTFFAVENDILAMTVKQREVVKVWQNSPIGTPLPDFIQGKRFDFVYEKMKKMEEAYHHPWETFKILYPELYERTLLQRRLVDRFYNPISHRLTQEYSDRIHAGCTEKEIDAMEEKHDALLIAPHKMFVHKAIPLLNESHDALLGSVADHVGLTSKEKEDLGHIIRR